MQGKGGISKEASTLVLANLSFAQNTARQFYRQRASFGCEREDLEGAAMLGLCDAARRFDPSRCSSFRTFAYLRIRGAMYDMIRDHGGFARGQFNRVICNKRQITTNKLKSEKFIASEEDNQTPFLPQRCTDEKQLPYTFAATLDELKSLLEVLEEVDLKLWVASEGGVDLSYNRQCSAENLTIARNSRRYFLKLIQKLNPTQRSIIKRRYYYGETFEKISSHSGHPSKSWACRVHSQALAAIREMMEQDRLKCERRLNAVGV